MTRLIVVAAGSIGLILFAAFVSARLLRSWQRGLSIRLQVFMALFLIDGSFAVGLGLMVLDRIEARAVRFATQGATEEAGIVARLVADEVRHTGVSLQHVAERFRDHESEAAQSAQSSAPTMELRSAEGQVLYRSPESAQVDERWVAVVATIRVGDRNIGSVRVLEPTLVMRQLLQDFAPTVLIISLVLSAAAALAAAWIGRAIAAPIEALTSFAERVSAGAALASPPAARGPEVERLTKSIDSMRRQVEGRPFVETFAADLSHELKNPVAAIRASAEILDEGALDEPAEARRFVGRILEATERIERLLRELLSLASIEARGVDRLESVDLGAVVRSTAASFVPSQHRIRIETEGDLRVRGEERWLRRAVGNLIDNALVHSPAETTVTLRALREQDRVLLQVGNEGALSRHVGERAFSRFVTTRPDKGGTGLGLAIVRAVAESHGGHAELTAMGPPRVELTLDLPAARRRPALRDRAAQSPERQ